jgi:hypothetical protein
MRRVYYAHAKCLYGRLDEQQELRAIHRRFRRASIVNPAEHDRDPRLIAQRWKKSRGQRSALIPVIRFPSNQGQ